MTAVGATAADYFGSMVASYDSLIRRAVPRYDEMLARLLDYLPSGAGAVLELGCGTGNLSVALVQRYPRAAFTFIDASPEMLRTTAERLGGNGRYLEMKFEELHNLTGRFDLVVSSISLHHVRDKSPLYRSIRSLLMSGGALRFSDQIRGATEEIHGINWQKWLEFCRAPGNCSEDEVQSLLDHADAHDHYTPLREHFSLLHDAGFRNLDCVWRNLIWGIVTADLSDATMNAER